MRARRRTWFVLSAAALSAGILGMVVAPDASAIPAFARKYRQSCTTCHAPFPRLKSYGEDFAARGFRMEPGAEPATASLDTGDPSLSLPRDFPIAVRLEGYASWKKDARAEADFEFPWVWKILSGGPIGDRFSYYFYFLIEQGDVIGLEDAYLQFNRPFGLPFDIMAGQFQVSDPLFKRELRLERFDYEMYKFAPGMSGTNLTYDRGLMVPIHVPAVDLVFEVVNGNGIPGAEEGEHDFDGDKYKNVALRASTELGPARVGIFGYLGKQELLEEPTFLRAPPASTKEAGAGAAPQAERGAKNQTWYWGPDATLAMGETWTLNLQYLERRDDNPYFAASVEENGMEGDDYVTRGGFAELVFLPQGEDGLWAIAGLYNLIDSDDPHLDRYMSASATLSYLLNRNLRLLTEGGWTREEVPTVDGTRETNGGRFSVGVVAAF